MDSVPEIRDYRPEDAPRCHAMRQQTFLEVFSETLSPERARLGAETLDVSGFAKCVEGAMVFIAALNETVLGFCALWVHSPVEAEILYLYVDVELRGRGLGVHGATVSACVRDYAGRMDFLRRFWDAAIAEDPAAREQDEGLRFPLCHPEVLTELMDQAGMVAVVSAAIEVPTEFSSFEDYWKPFLGGTGPAPSYVASLGEERRAALAARIEETLPVQADGSFAISARAWAARGILN